MSHLSKLIEELCPNGVEFVKVGDIAKITRGKVMSKDFLRDNAGEYPVYSSQTENDGMLGSISTYMFDGEYVTWTTDGANAGSVFYRNGRFNITNVCGLIDCDTSKMTKKFLYYALSLVAPNYVNRGMGNPKLMSNVMARVEVPLPPLPVQREIVKILDNFTELTAELTAELELRKKQYAYYRDKLLAFEGEDVEWVTLGEVGEIKMCKRVFKDQTSKTGDVPFYKIGTFGGAPDAYISRELFEEYSENYSYPRKGELLLSCSGTLGRVVEFDGKPAYFQDSNIVWLSHDESRIKNSFLKHVYASINWTGETGGTISRLYGRNIKSQKIPLPPLEEQQRIVDILDKFDALVNDLNSGIPAEIEGRKKQYEYYREKLLELKRVDKV